MKKLHIFFLLCIFIIFPFVSKSQIQSTEGVDFWTTFLYNHSSSSQTTLIISAQRACTGTIQNPNTGWSTTFSVPAQGRTQVTIPNAQAYCTSSATTDNKGIHITATDTISLYASNFIDYTFDATGVLPTPALGNEYIIQTYTGTFNGANIAMIATENGTTLDITPTEATPGHPANVTFSITLNRGQVFQMITASNGDLSGTHIVSRDCKKFAVLGGCRCTQVPNGSAYCDHIVEQMWPISSWGKEFIVTNSLQRTRDRVRVTASTNGTQVYRDGSLITTLNARGTYEFEISSSQPAFYVHSTQPIATYLYYTGSTYGGGYGDPSSVWISPIEQRISKITFGTFQPGQTLTQYINIVCPTAGVPLMRLDGANIASAFSIVPGNPAYSYARRSISHATHTLEGDSGFVAHIYGLGHDESYAFSCGSSAANLVNKLFVNNVASVDIQANQEYCMNDTIVFRAQVETNYDGIRWEFGDGITDTGEVVTHVYPTYGYYTVYMIIDRRSSDNNCGGFDTISTFVRILQNETFIYDSVCAGFPYNANGLNIPSAQHDTAVTTIFPSFWGCDSVVHVNLYVSPIDPYPVYDDICIGKIYDENGFNITADSVGLITDTLYLTSSLNCDSTVILYLNVYPIDPIPISATICVGETYTDNGFNIFGGNVGIIKDTLHLTSSIGCDSTVILTLQVAPLPTINLGRDIVLCHENDFPVRLDAGSGLALYEWSTGATSQTITVPEVGTYSVTVTSYDNCVNSDEITIDLHHVDVTISQDPEDFCISHSAVLTANTEAPNILWNTGETTPTIMITKHGSYYVTVTDGFCEASARIGIKECPFNVYWPNAFTPYLNDGTNDYFQLHGEIQNIKEFEIHIYDRWGQLVFKADNVHFKWDGKVYGAWIPNHVFSYVMHVTTILGKKEVYKGTITVL